MTIMKVSKSKLMFFENDDEFLNFCLSPDLEIKKDENTGLFYHDYPFSENYISSLEEDKCFIIKDPNSLIVKRGCVCKGLITKPVENLYMICDNEH